MSAMDECGITEAIASRCNGSDTIPELPDLLLIIPGGDRACGTETQRNRGAAARLDDPRHRSTEEGDAVAQSQLSSVVLVLLDQVT